MKNNELIYFRDRCNKKALLDKGTYYGRLFFSDIQIYRHNHKAMFEIYNSCLRLLNVHISDLLTENLK